MDAIADKLNNLAIRLKGTDYEQEALFAIAAKYLDTISPQETHVLVRQLQKSGTLFQHLLGSPFSYDAV